MVDKYQDMSKHQALYDAVVRAQQDEHRHEFVCLDCGEDKAVGDMATECPAIQHAVTGQRTGACKECYALDRTPLEVCNGR